MPLKSLVVIHPDEEYLKDVKSLESYITSELNILELIPTADEEKYGVKYKASADFAVLGKRLKKDLAKVKNALPALTSDQIREYMRTGKIDVNGVMLGEGDLNVTREPAQSESNKNLEANTDNDVLTILDTALYPELVNEGLAREIINRVQRLRKKAGLVPTDDIKMEYKVLKDPIGLEDVFTRYTDTFEKALRRPLDKAVITTIEEVKPGENLDKVILEEEQEVNDATFLLRLLKL